MIKRQLTFSQHLFYPLNIIHSYCVCWHVSGVGGGWVWTCTVIFQLCSRGPYASVRRCIMIIKHTDVGVWFCRWNIKQCRAWCAVMIWWLPSGFWKGRNNHIAFQSRPTDVLTQSEVSGFFFLSLVCINWSWSKKSISLFMEIKVVVRDFWNAADTFCSFNFAEQAARCLGIMFYSGILSSSKFKYILSPSEIFIFLNMRH